jgi:hypothetical protein
LIERAFSDLALIQQRGDQHLAVDLHLSYGQFVRKFSVLLRGHPIGSNLRLRPPHQVIATAERGTAPKVSMARPILFEQHVDARRDHGRDQEIVAVELLRPCAKHQYGVNRALWGDQMPAMPVVPTLVSSNGVAEMLTSIICAN